jgi:hypothetical protein
MIDNPGEAFLSFGANRHTTICRYTRLPAVACVVTCRDPGNRLTSFIVSHHQQLRPRLPTSRLRHPARTKFPLSGEIELVVHLVMNVRVDKHEASANRCRKRLARLNVVRNLWKGNARVQIEFGW